MPWEMITIDNYDSLTFFRNNLSMLEAYTKRNQENKLFNLSLSHEYKSD